MLAVTGDEAEQASLQDGILPLQPALGKAASENNNLSCLVSCGTGEGSQSSPPWVPALCHWTGAALPAGVVLGFSYSFHYYFTAYQQSPKELAASLVLHIHFHFPVYGKRY